MLPLAVGEVDDEEDGDGLTRGGGGEEGGEEGRAEVDGRYQEGRAAEVGEGGQYVVSPQAVPSSA